MYHFVTDKEFLKSARMFCSKIVCSTQNNLRHEGINVRSVLIGSGARNLVTRNAEEPIDFDFNLVLVNSPMNQDCKMLKEKVRKCFNKALKSYKQQDCDDSTSVLTSKIIYLQNGSKVGFTIDICIIYEDGDRWYRLIHEKNQSVYEKDRWYWNNGFTKYNYADKAKKLKKDTKAWMKVRNRYLDKKNLYLKRGDHDHTSFICYIEAVNEVYNEAPKIEKKSKEA